MRSSREQRVYRLRHYYPDAEQGLGPAGAAGPADDARGRGLRRLADDERGDDPARARRRSMGGRLRRSRDARRAGSSGRSPTTCSPCSDAVERVLDATGREVHLGGYSQGGMFVYQTAAYRRNDGLSSLITFGSPVDTRVAMPFGLPEQFAAGAAGLLADRVFRGWALPAWASRTGFRMLDPVKSMRNRLEFILQLHDREALLPRERQRRFLEADGWVAWPGPAMADFLRQFIAHNRMLEGGFVIEDRLVTLADIESPILSVVGTRRRDRAGRRGPRDPTSGSAGGGVRAGVCGRGTSGWSSARPRTRSRGRPSLRGPAGARATASCPAEVTAVPDDNALELSPEVRNRVGYGLELAGAVGAGMARSVFGTARRTARTRT